MRNLIIIFVLTLLGVLVTEQIEPQMVEAGVIKAQTIQQKPIKVELSSVNTEIAESANIPQKTVTAPHVSSGGDIQQIVREAARKYGIDEEHFVRIAHCESSMNPSAQNRSYSENGVDFPSGLFQHLTNYWDARAAKYGYAGASVFDPVANANVTAGMFRDGSQGLWECRG